MIIGIVAGALAVRLVVCAMFVGVGAPPDRTAAPDQADYELLAFRFSTGYGYTLADDSPTARRPPGTSLILGSLYFFTGRNWGAGRFFFCAISALVCCAAALLLWHANKPIEGLLAAALIAIHPACLYYPLHFLSEAPFALFVTLAAATAYRGSNTLSTPTMFAAGTLLGLAILVRPHAFLAIPFALSAAMLGARGGKRWLYFRCVTIMSIGSLLVVAPWLIRNHRVLGRPTLSTVGGPTFWGGNNDLVMDDPDLAGTWVPRILLQDSEHPKLEDEVADSRATFSYGLSVLRNRIDEVPRLLVAKLRRLLSPFEITENRPLKIAFAASWIVTAPLVCLGMAVLWREDRLLLVVLTNPILFTVTTTLIFYGSTRFRHSIAPIYLMLAAIGVRWLLDRYASGTMSRHRGISA